VIEQEMRQRIIDEARKWLGTKWHHEARKLGAGVDCGMLLLEVFEAVGILPHIEPAHYARDFMLHRNEEWFLELVQKYADEIFETPLIAGDVILYRNGRSYSHGAIVIDWPLIIHASATEGIVCYGNAALTPLSQKKQRYFRYKK